MASIGAIITSTYYTKQLNPRLNSSPRRVVNYSQENKTQQILGNKPQQKNQATAKAKASHSKRILGNFYHQYVADLLAS